MIFTDKRAIERKRGAALVMSLVTATMGVTGFTSRASGAQTEYTVETYSMEITESFPDRIPDSISGQAEGQKEEIFDSCQTLSTTLENGLRQEKKEAEKRARERAEKLEEEEKKAEEKKAAERKVSASGDTQKLLASIIFCEAGNQSYEGQVAVGAVVMNRVRSSSFPDTVEKVIYQKGQFTPASTGWLDKVRSSGGYTDSAMRAAKDALAGANPIGDCLYFDQGGHGMKIGAHYFH